MTTSIEKLGRTLPYTFLGASVVLVGLQLWDVAQWSSAWDQGHTQSERVSYYLTHLPLGLGQLGAISLTWLSAACGALGCAAAIVASRRVVGAVRIGAGALAGLNALLALWYLFSLM